MPQAVSTRWCPTPQQLLLLQDMYRAGVRNPNAFQIQQITSHLSFYGKIEGKNVFYWFQNHKARERQKIRKRMMMQRQLQHQCHLDHRIGETKLHVMPAENHPFVYHHSQGTALNYMYKMVSSDCKETSKDAAEGNGENQEWRITIQDQMNSEQSVCRSTPLKTLDLFPISSSNSSSTPSTLTSTNRSPSSSSSTDSNTLNSSKCITSAPTEYLCIA